MMRILISFFLLFSMMSFAQDKTRGTIKVRKGACVLIKGDKFVYAKVDEMPKFPPGDAWVRENLVYPRRALESGKNGKVMAGFTVLPDGSLANTRILSTTDTIFNSECIRLLTKMPKWVPGKCNGVAVPVEFILPMRFSLN